MTCLGAQATISLCICRTHICMQVPYWCFVMGSPQERSRICYIKADQAKRGMHVLGLMPKLAAIDDIVLFNLGIHYNNMYQLEEDMTMVASALTQTGLPKNVFWVETAPQHFDTPDGELYIWFAVI